MNLRGGKRNGSGRKKVKDKAIPITIYIRKSVIQAKGGKDKAREIATKSLTI